MMHILMAQMLLQVCNSPRELLLTFGGEKHTCPCLAFEEVGAVALSGLPPGQSLILDSTLGSISPELQKPTFH